VLLQPMTCQCLLSRPLTLKRRTTEIFQELESNGQRLAMCSFAHEVRNAKPSPSPTPCPATPLQSLRVCQMQCTAAGCSSCELPSSRLCVTRPLGSPIPWEGGSRGASAATSAAAASSAVEASLDPDGAPTPAEQVGRIFVEFEDRPKHVRGVGTLVITRLTGPKRPRRTLTAGARPSLKGRLASVAVHARARVAVPAVARSDLDKIDS